MAASVGLDAGNVETQPDGVGGPAGGHDGERRPGGALNALPAVDHADTACRLLETIDRSEALVDADADGRKGGCDRGGDVLVLGVEYARADLEQVDPRTEGGEDRRDLHPGRSRSDDEKRGRDSPEGPGVAVRGGELEAGDWQPAALPADTEDDLLAVEREPVLGLDSMRVDEAGEARVLVNGHSQCFEIAAQRRMDTSILDHLAHPSQEPRVVERFAAHVDAVEPELAALADQPRCVRERTDGNRTVVGRHAPEGVARHEGRLGPEPRGASGGDDPCRPGADNQDVGPHRGRPDAQAAVQEGNPCSSESRV